VQQTFVNMGPSTGAVAGGWGVNTGPALSRESSTVSSGDARGSKRPVPFVELELLQASSPLLGHPDWLRSSAPVASLSQAAANSQSKRPRQACWGISLSVPSETRPAEVCHRYATPSPSALLPKTYPCLRLERGADGGKVNSDAWSLRLRVCARVLHCQLRTLCMQNVEVRFAVASEIQHSSR